MDRPRRAREPGIARRSADRRPAPARLLVHVLQWRLLPGHQPGNAVQQRLPTTCPNGYSAVQRNLGDCIVVTNDYCKGTASPVTLTNAYCGNCVIVYAEAKTGSVCVYPTSPANTNGNIPGGTNTVTFPQNLDPSGYSQFALLLNCV